MKLILYSPRCHHSSRAGSGATVAIQNNLSRRSAMKRSLLLFLIVLSSVRAFAEKPNIVLVLVDDLGWADLACQGSTSTRPGRQIGKGRCSLHQWLRGLVGVFAVTAAVQTGRYPHRTGITNWIRSRALGAKAPKDGRILLGKIRRISGREKTS